MSFRRFPAAAAQQAARLLPVPAGVSEAQIRQAAWVARCVGRGQAAPLRSDDVAALASLLAERRFPPGAVIFAGGQLTPGVWIVREGRIELSVGSGRRRAVVQLLRPGDVDGDIQLLLDMPLPYTGRAVSRGDLAVPGPCGVRGSAGQPSCDCPPVAVQCGPATGR
jgi:CRP/FNR family transcriptional regulator, cAMP and macrophage regulator